MRKIVIEDRSAAYPDPIHVSAGDKLTLSGERDLWDGHEWLWAKAPDGRSGWMPAAFIAAGRGETCAARDYSAVELSCRKGELLEVIEESHGWAWCRSVDGSEGWAPLRILSQE